MSIIDFSNKKSPAFKGTYANLLSDFATKSTVVPTIALESTVLAGRSYHARKRGGDYEFKESLLEEIVAAVIWIGGVKSLNKLSDNFFKSCFKIDTSVDWGKIDSLTEGRLNPEKFKKTLIAAKSSKLLFSVLTSVAAVGYLLPKIKQRYTKDKIKNEIRKPISENYEIKPFNDSAVAYAPSFRGSNYKQNITVSNVSNNEKNSYSKFFKLADYASTAYNSAFRGAINQETLNNSNITNKTTNFSNDNDLSQANNSRDNAISFKGSYETLVKVGFALDNSAIAQLSVVDTGITGGRVVTARNKDEGFEFFFRDVSSWLFYLKTTPWIVNGLAATFDKTLNINTQIDPKVYEPLAKEISELFTKSVYNQKLSQLDPNTPITVHFENFKEVLQGVPDKEFVKVLDQIINTQTNKQMNLAELNLIAEQLKNNLLTELNQPLAIEKINQNILASTKRAIDIALHNKDCILYEKFRNMDNLIDDLQKSNDDIIHLAERSKALKQFLYHKNQAYKAITPQDMEVIAQLARDVKSSTFDAEVLAKIDSLFQDVVSAYHNEGIIFSDNLEEIFRGGITRNSAVLNRVLTFVKKEYANPTKDLDPSLTKNLSKNLESYLDIILKEIETSLDSTQNITKDESILSKFSSIANKLKNKTLGFKTAYFSAGFLFSAAFLAIIIPRTQQQLTRLRTGHNKFPGVSGLVDDETSIRTKNDSLTIKSALNNSHVSSRSSKSTISDDFDTFMQKSFITTSP